MSNTGGDTGFDGVFGRGRGSERAHVEEVDIVVAFVGGHTKRSPELSSLCAEIGDLGRRRVFSFLVDGRGKLLGIRSAHPFPSSAQHVAFTVIGGSFKRKLLSACAPIANSSVETWCVSERVLMTRLAADAATRTALVLAGVAEREFLLGLVEAGLTERQRAYLQAVAQTPGADMYVLGAATDGRRLDKIEAVAGDLMRRGLLNTVNYPALALSKDGSSVYAMRPQMKKRTK